MNSQHDEQYMRMALNLARRGLGHVAPNPSVGCVIVKNGVIIARGRTAHGGRPHAEAAALADAGDQAKGATVYVTLEPCAVHGRAGPCSEALIKAQVACVVVACHDLNPVVYKKGIALLEEAGIEVRFGVLEEEATFKHAGFFSRVVHNRPFVTLKCARSSDGMIAAAPGERTQISGTLAQKHMHLRRSMQDAILVGSGTYLADAPQLTTRIEGYAHEPLRVVLDRRGRVDAPGFLVMDEVDPERVLNVLAEKGVNRLLVEGGAEIHKAFLDAGFVDVFEMLVSPKTLGAGGVKAVDVSAYEGLKLEKTLQMGEDRLEIYHKAH